MDRRKGENDSCSGGVGELQVGGESKDEWKFLTMPLALVSHQPPLSLTLHLISARLVSPTTSLLPPDFSSQLKTF